MDSRARRVVAQIFNLLYRRFATCRARDEAEVDRVFERLAEYHSATQQIANLRYGRGDSGPRAKTAAR